MLNKLNIRIDKWLWFVRIFKTRSLATHSCLGGKVKCEGVVLKPSREVKQGDVYSVNLNGFEKRVRVINTPTQRIGAKLVADYYEDITLPEEYEKLKLRKEPFEFRQHGSGRPTKRERRQIDFLKNNYPIDNS